MGVEKAILVGAGLKSDSFSELKESLFELEDLVSAAGAEIVGSLVQVLPKFHSATLIGKGKIEEIKELAEETGATLIVIDHQLSGVQARNLSQDIGVDVLDRSQIILDIFAQRAQTYEGKLQVELAQMLDQLPRMVGAWLGSLSRQAGGIGTRGPGESALEIDRRRINDRIKLIKKKLEDVRKNRQQHRQKRKKQAIPSFALMGYTNSGKSTLLNKITQSDVLAKDQVFATLDPTTRKIHLPECGEAVITDTVGFIRKLPTKLIEAFKATLEESGEADVLICVLDISNEQMESHLEVIDELIEEFQWDNKPIIYVYNKIDSANMEEKLRADRDPRVFISALTGEGLPKLIEQMQAAVQSFSQEVELFFPKEQEQKMYELGRESKINRTEPGSTGTICFAHLTEKQLSRWSDYLVK